MEKEIKWQSPKHLHIQNLYKVSVAHIKIQNAISKLRKLNKEIAYKVTAQFDSRVLEKKISKLQRWHYSDNYGETTSTSYGRAEQLTAKYAHLFIGGKLMAIYALKQK